MRTAVQQLRGTASAPQPVLPCSCCCAAESASLVCCTAFAREGWAAHAVCRACTSRTAIAHDFISRARADAPARLAAPAPTTIVMDACCRLS